ncbi:rolling circle replication-associated protein [Selenomonas sp. F0473]|uniref:rolling circle replication-associated protein n=1 Tax=Selenomonas sp. F0473 TaxID=999423 RepID=UPI003F92E8DA
MPYLRKIIKHGDVIEDCKYVNGRFGQKIRNGQRAGVTPAAQKEWQKKNAVKKLWRLIDDNFAPGDLWITLTYPAHTKPDKETIKRHMEIFIKALRRAYKKAGKEFKYIYSVGRGKRGAAHIHLILPKFDLEIIRNQWARICNAGSYVRTDFQPLHMHRDYYKLAAYLIKNSEEDFQSEDPVYKKRYCSSKNLYQNNPRAKIVSARTWKKEPPERAGYFIDKERSYNGHDNYGCPVQYTVYVRLHPNSPSNASINKEPTVTMSKREEQ